MTAYLKKSPIIVIAAVLAVIFVFFIRANRDSLQLAGVKEFTLSPTDVEIPSVRSQTDRRYVAKNSSRYVFRRDGDQDHLFFVNDGTFEKVIGDMPTRTASRDLDFRDFTDVVSPSGITTYFCYVEYKGGWVGSINLVASDLYALKGNRVHKVLSHIQPAGISTYIEKRMSPTGTYLDQRDYLYALTLDSMLCVIQDGQIIAKADVSKIGAKQPALPSMFSDADNTYVLVPKLFDSQNSMGGGPVNESNIKAKYKINLPRQ
jgi:hypothetical protein